jgi:Family of unknown function (DUF6492)
LSHLPRSFHESDVPVSVLIPLAEKDLVNAGLAIDSIRKNLRHPIEQIIIVGQNSAKISEFCAAMNVVYINEENILGPRILDLKFEINGKNNSGWIRQQIIKLTAFNYVNANNILLHDADTVFVRPLSFFNEEKRQLLFTSDEYMKSYHRMTVKLLGPISRYRRSFIAHGMLFQRDLWIDLVKSIELHCKTDFVTAIISVMASDKAAVLSEYELYGNFLYNHHPDRYYLRYWFNFQLLHHHTDNLELLMKKYTKYNSVSHHIRPHHIKRKKLRLSRWYQTPRES